MHMGFFYLFKLQVLESTGYSIISIMGTLKTFNHCSKNYALKMKSGFRKKTNI